MERLILPKILSNPIPSIPETFFRRKNFPPYYLQPKLTINQPNDPFEQEADAMADRVMRMSNGMDKRKPFFSPSISSLQKKCANCEQEDKELQRKETAGGDVKADNSLENFVSRLDHSGLPLAREVRDYYEPRFGYDFGEVKVHTDHAAAKSAQSINALAYTSGNNIVFNQGRYSPDSSSGKRLLGHELTHVVQQNSSINRKIIQRAENDTSIGCHSLTDTKSDVNSYVNAALTALRPASAAAQISGVRGGIGSDMITSPGRTQIEGWAEGLPVTKAHQPLASTTKYRGVTYVIWSNPLFPILNPTMKVNGVCIGSDKLGHFFQQGYEYYQESHRSGGSVSTAVAAGQAQESGGYGLRTTGVYSNADLEANRRGLDFYNHLATAPSMSFDIASYINGNWSEVDNPNLYESSTGQIVWRNLLTGTWNGIFQGNSPMVSRQITASLIVNPSNNTSITGTFSHNAGRGTISGNIIHNTIAAPGATPGTTAISGIIINYNWVSGSNSGKGIWTNGGENRLLGTWGNGTSNNNGGNWEMSK